MGSVVGGVASYLQYKKSEKALKSMEARQAAAEREAKALTPATATNPEGGAESEAAMKKKRRGVQATFTAKESQSASSGTIGE
jgi:hypothetical protein